MLGDCGGGVGRPFQWSGKRNDAVPRNRYHHTQHKKSGEYYYRFLEFGIKHRSIVSLLCFDSNLIAVDLRVRG